MMRAAAAAGAQLMSVDDIESDSPTPSPSSPLSRGGSPIATAAAPSSSRAPSNTSCRRSASTCAGSTSAVGPARDAASDASRQRSPHRQYTSSERATDRLDAQLQKIRERDGSAAGSRSPGDEAAEGPPDVRGGDCRPHSRKLWPLPAGTRRVGSFQGAPDPLSRRNVPGVATLLERELEERLTSLVMQMVLAQQ